MFFIRFSLCLGLLNPMNFLYAQTDSAAVSSLFLEAVEIKVLRHTDKAPFAKTLMQQKEIEQNYGVENLPAVLQNTPSFVAYNESGLGIGQTFFRIRGSDHTRINVSINGVIFSDPESGGNYIGNIPDILSSAKSLQIQRGIGSSSNAGNNFGANINIETDDYSRSPKLDATLSYGSFNSTRNSLKLYSGLMHDHFTFNLRLSQVHSDGYIENGKTNYYAGYASLGYWQKKYNLRLNYFGGYTDAYQTYNGVNAAGLRQNRRANTRQVSDDKGQILYIPKDRYLQQHFQLIYNHSLTQHISITNTVFTVLGGGFFDKYRKNRALSAQNSDFANANREPVLQLLRLYDQQNPDPIKSDYIIQDWLKNIFFGNLFGLRAQWQKHELNFGYNMQHYAGDHPGYISNITIIPNWQSTEFYRYRGNKSDFNSYIKWSYTINKYISSFVDIQGRFVSYQIRGDRRAMHFNLNRNFTFFNPKIGLSYRAGKYYNGFISLAMANREPMRSDFINDGDPQKDLKNEILYDIEIGNSIHSKNISFSNTSYLMFYDNQLVATGARGEFGGALRANVGKSFRLGTENEAHFTIIKKLSLSLNAAFSLNKIINPGQKSVPISFSPNHIHGYQLRYQILKALQISLSGRYIGRQFLDNSGDKALSLPGYYVQDAQISYQLPVKKGRIRFSLLFNNIFNTDYATNGYVYEEAYFFPAALFNLAGKVHISF